MTLIYFISLLLCIITYVLGVYKVKYMFRREFPDTKLERHSWPDLLLSYLKLTVVMVCPVVNTFLALNMVFNMDDICERTMDSLRQKYKKT